MEAPPHDTRLRILWVVSKLTPVGGIGRVVWQATEALALRGHDVHAAGPLRELNIPPIPSVTQHPWPMRHWKFLYLRRLIRLQQTLRANVIHFHNALPHGELIGPLRVLRRALGNPKIVVTPHTGMRTHYPKRRARLGLRAADSVVAVSEWSAAKAIAAGADPNRTSVIYNGVNPPRFVNTAARQPLVIALGKLKKTKGIHDLIAAFSRAASERPDWRLRIGGVGPEMEALRAQAAASPCSNRIELPGLIVGEAKRELLEQASVGVVPSHGENFPGALLEFQTHGLACIASNVGGIPELAQNAAALLVPPGNVEALAKALGELMDQPARQRALSEAARRSAMNLTWDAAAERLEALYRAGLNH